MSLSPVGPSPRHRPVRTSERWGSTAPAPFALDARGARCLWVERPLLATVFGADGVLAVVYVSGPMLPTIVGPVDAVEWAEASRGCGYSLRLPPPHPTIELWGWPKGSLVAAFHVHLTSGTIHCSQCGKDCGGVDGVQAHLKTAFASPPMRIINHKLVRARFDPQPLNPAAVPPPVDAAAVRARLCLQRAVASD